MQKEAKKCDLCGRYSMGQPKCRDHIVKQFVKLNEPR